MPDKNEERISRHLREVKAKRKTTSFDSLVKRLKLEQEYRNILVALEEYEITWQEVMPSLTPEKKVEFAPDFFLWKYNVKVPLFLIEYKKDGYTISRNELVEYLNLLKKTDYDIVMTVWMSSPSFPCKVFKVADIERYIESGNAQFAIDDASSFKQRILDFFNEEISTFPVVKFDTIPKLREPEKLLKSFESTLKETVETEMKSRRPYLPHRKEAMAAISDKDLDKTHSLISKYFMGELEAKDVIRLLKELVEIRHNI